MNGTNRTKVIAYLAGNQSILDGLSIKPLANNVFSATGIHCPVSTLGRLRQDLGWPTLRRKSEDPKVRIAKLEEQMAFLIKENGFELPDNLK